MALASAAIITGSVTDTNKEPVIGANVRLLSLPDSTFVQAVSSDYDGNFVIDSVSPGRYTISASQMEMHSAPLTLRIDTPEDSLPLPAMVMKDETTRLQDLVVTATKAAVVAREDTIEYNAGSFKTKQNAVVEDLLKKLPGVTVESDGSISSGGKTISKILVDGQEFFSDDPKMASKNLPAEMVDKVQIIDNKSDLAKLTGVDDGEEETVINLTIKKGMKNGWFGKVMGGYGTDNRYNFGFNVSHFRDNNQLTILGASNNVNDLTFTDTGMGRFRMGNFGNQGIATSHSLGVNFSVGKTDDFRVGGNVLYTYNDRKFTQKAETQYIFPDSVSYQNSDSKTRSKGHNLRADLRLQWNIDANNTIDFRPRFSFNSSNNFSADTTLLRGGLRNGLPGAQVNRQDNFKKAKGKSYQASGDLIYSHKFTSKAGRTLSFQAKYDFSDTPETQTTWNDITYYLLQDDSEKLFRFIDSRQWSNSVEGRVTYVEPIGDPAKGNFLNFAYMMKYSFNNADRYAWNLPEYDEAMTEAIFKGLSVNGDNGTLDEALSNRFRNNYFTQELQLSYKKVAAKYNLEAGMIFSPSMSKSTDLINHARDIKEQWVYNVAPFLRFRYRFSKTEDLRVDYRARTTAPTLTQLQPVADTSDPLHITIGNPDLKPTFTQSIMAGYHSYNVDSQRMLMGMINASHTLNGIVSRTISDPETGVQTTDYVNVNNGFQIMGGGMFNQQIPNTHWRLSADLFANYSLMPGYMNGELNRAGNLMIRPSLGITYSLSVLQISARPTYSFQYTHNSLPGSGTRKVHSFGGTADASVYLNNGLEFSTDLDFSKTSGYASGYNSSQWLWNAQVSYSFLAGKSLTLALKVYDILQQKRSISRSVTASYIRDEQVNALTRYAMLTLTYTFQTYKGTRNNSNNGMMGEDGPPEPPSGSDGPPAGGTPPPGAGGPPPM